MAKIEIRKGIPLPTPTGRGRECKYPWPEMEVGDSFKSFNDVQESTIRHLASYHSRAGKKFAVRKNGDEIAVWRTA